LANFIAELSPHQIGDEDLEWNLHVDGSSNSRLCGAGVLLEGPGDILLEQALKFDFKTSNNQVKYEAIIVGLNLALDMEAKQLVCISDSQLVFEQLKGEFEVKESLLQRYYHFVRNLIAKFNNVKIEHICREHNTRADMLSRLATVKKKGLHRSIIYINLKNPNISTNECMTTEIQTPWMTPIK